MTDIRFKPLEFYDIPTIHQWFNKPHVQEFYSLRHWTSEKSVMGFMILINQHPIGYMKYYKVKNYPWVNQNLAEDIIEYAAGMDLFYE